MNAVYVLSAIKSSNFCFNNQTCMKLKPLSSFAETFMVNFMTSLNSLRLEDNSQDQGISSSAILLIEDTIPSKPSNSSSVISLNTPKTSFCSGEIISPGKLPLCMDSTMKSWKSTGAQLHGSISTKLLTTFLWEPLSKIKFSASTEDSLQILRQSTRWEPSIEKWKFLIKVFDLFDKGPFCDLMWSDP